MIKHRILFSTSAMKMLIVCIFTFAGISLCLGITVIEWKENSTLFGYEFTTNIAFISNTTKLRCAEKCSIHDSCLSWTYSESRCIGYNTIFTDTANVYLVTSSQYFMTDDKVLIQDCSNLKMKGKTSGVYTIYPPEIPNGVTVYCDMDTDGGAWIVFQNRFDGSVDFYETWSNYKNGFGDLNGEFWLGNKYIHLLTKDNDFLLRIDLEDNSGIQKYATYTTFTLNGESDKYRLTINGYSGTAGDGGYGFKYNNNGVFSTRDQDSTSSCTNNRKGGWWYKGCTWVNPNGLWTPGTSSWSSMMWKAWTNLVGVKKTSMKLKKK